MYINIHGNSKAISGVAQFDRWFLFMDPIELLQHSDDIAALLEQPLPDLIIETIGLTGITTLLYALIFFTVWGIFQVVRLFKNIIK